MRQRFSSSLQALACLALLLAAAPTRAQTFAGLCGVKAGGKRCAKASHCCNKWGVCGTTNAYCGVANCVSGPCKKAPGAASPSPSPTPSPVPWPSPEASTPPSPKPPTAADMSSGEAPFPAFPAELGNATHQYSWLWGRDGELWRPTGRLADWSYAGYMAGDKLIPDFGAAIFSVKDYGAKGDGQTDDTQAILAAVKAASARAAALLAAECGKTGCKGGFGNEGRQGVVVLLPAGRYVVTQTIEIKQSNVVVRGEGVNSTTLYFPKPLSAIYGNAMQWSYAGGFLNCQGKRYTSSNTQFRLATLKSSARKGDRRLSVSSTAGITVGRWVRLFAQNPTAAAAPALRRLLSDDEEQAEGSIDSAAGAAGDEQQQQQQIAVTLKLSAQQLGIEADSWDSLIEQLVDQIEDLPDQLRQLLQQLLSGSPQPETEETQGCKRHKHRHGSSGRKGGSGCGSGHGDNGSDVDSSGDDGDSGSSGTSQKPSGKKPSGKKPNKPSKPSKDKDRSSSGGGTKGSNSSPSLPPSPSPSPQPGSTAPPPPSAPIEPPSSSNATNVPRNSTAEGACADAPDYLALTESLREGCLEAEALGLSQQEEPAAAAGNNSTNTTSDGSGDKAPGLAAGGTLDAYIYGRVAGAFSGTTPFKNERIRFASRVAAVGNGWIELERPLPYDVHPDWGVAVHSFEHPVQHVGYENFSVEFKFDKYPAHLKAKGYNAFFLNACANTWVRNVHIQDADNGLEAINADFVTAQNISFSYTAPRGVKTTTQDCSGHHGLWAAASSNVLFTDNDFCSANGSLACCFIHDLTYDVYTQESVYANSKGIDMSLDMHRGGCHNNLWSNIDLGRGNRAFFSSGQMSQGAHSAANNTWWAIHASKRPAKSGPLQIRECGYGPLLNFVGTTYSAPAGGNSGISPRASPPPSRLFPGWCTQTTPWHVEQLRPGATLHPMDLYTAMLRTRRARLGLPETP